ncbi:UNVERIFIED_CONTAM: hypothetical protein GTU68_007515 [Idotea baltica]|nr:hypothetical protein [Idotea baltica]
MTLTIRDALAGAVETLKDQSEAETLLAEAINKTRAFVRLNGNDVLSSTQVEKFQMFVNSRQRHQPVSQIIGHRDFWKHNFIVTPDVLDPRPDTETLVEAALNLGPFETILDLGTGSGCILLSLLDEWGAAQGRGVDVSDGALDVAIKNAERLNVKNRARFTLGNWCDGIFEKFDLVVSNPPYISADEMDTLEEDVRHWEPRIALTPEGDGLEAYRQIAAQAKSVMRDGAFLLLEIGFTQASEVCQILTNAGYADTKSIKDINGKDRVVSAVWNGES